MNRWQVVLRVRRDTEDEAVAVGALLEKCLGDTIGDVDGDHDLSCRRLNSDVASVSDLRQRLERQLNHAGEAGDAVQVVMEWLRDGGDA